MKSAIISKLQNDKGFRSVQTKKAVNASVNKWLLLCGIFSSVYYIAINIFVPLFDNGYNAASQTISELSAIDAPTKNLWVPLGFVYTLLILFFGWGVLNTSGKNHSLRITGILIFIYALAGFFWPFVPMHQRAVLAGGGATLTDTLHIILGIVSVILMLLSMGFGAATFGRVFRIYTIISMGALVLFGIMTGIDAPKVGLNLPTPFAGIWERINIGVFMLWLVVLSAKLLKLQKTLPMATNNQK